MMRENPSAINNDVDILVKDAQALFEAAAATSGDVAEDMRKNGMLLIDTAIARVRKLQNSAVATGKDAASSANAYVKTNPWRAIGVACGLGLLAGLIAGNR